MGRPICSVISRERMSTRDSRMERAFSMMAARDLRLVWDFWNEEKARWAFWPMVLISEGVAAGRVRIGLLVDGEIVVICPEPIVAVLVVRGWCGVDSSVSE